MRGVGLIETGIRGVERTRGALHTSRMTGRPVQLAQGTTHCGSWQHFELPLEVKDRFGMDLTYARLRDFKNSTDFLHR